MVPSNPNYYRQVSDDNPPEEAKTHEKIPPSEQDYKDAYRLAGKNWHSLSAEDTLKAIFLQHYHNLLSRAHRHVPDRGHGEILVGPVTMPV